MTGRAPDVDVTADALPDPHFRYGIAIVVVARIDGLDNAHELVTDHTMKTHVTL